MRPQDLTAANRWQLYETQVVIITICQLTSEQAACLSACKAVAAAPICYFTAAVGHCSRCGELVVAKCLPTQNHHSAATQPATLEMMKVQHSKYMTQTVGTESDLLLVHRSRRSRLGW